MPVSELPFWVVVALFAWFLGGVAGYYMMEYCDTSTGEKLNNNEFFVLDDKGGSFVTALLCAPIAFLAGLKALVMRRKYIQNLNRRIKLGGN